MIDKNGELHRPLRIKHEYSPYTVIFSKIPEYQEQESRLLQQAQGQGCLPTSSLESDSILRRLGDESDVPSESLPPVNDLFETCMYLFKRLEKSAEASRDEFFQVAANTRYYCSMINNEIKRINQAKGEEGSVVVTRGRDHAQILKTVHAQEQRIPQWDLHNICYHMLSDYTDETRWDFATSRLFIVLPSDLDAWNNADRSTHKFRLYFLCDSSNRDSWNHEGARADLPQHAHLSNHPGYNLSRPQQFFRVYGDYIMRVLRLVKHGYPRGNHGLPALDSFKVLWGCDPDIVGDRLTKDTLGFLVDKALAYLQELSPPKWEKRFLLTHSLSAAIKTHLNAPEGDQGESNLQRYIANNQRVYWMCPDHTHQFFDEQYLAELKTFVHHRGGHVDTQQAMLKVALISVVDAERFRSLLQLAKCTLNISLRLGEWHGMTRTHLQALCQDISATGAVILEIDGITTAIHPPDHGQFRKILFGFDDSYQNSGGLQLVTLFNYPGPQEQCIHFRDGSLRTTLAPAVTFQNWMDLKNSIGKLVHSVHNARGASKYSYGREGVRSALEKHGFPSATTVSLHGKTWAAVFDLEQGDFTEVHTLDMDCPKFVLSSGCLLKMTVDLKDKVFDRDFGCLVLPHSKTLQELNVSYSGGYTIRDIEHFVRSWPYSPDGSFRLTLLDQVNDIQCRVVAELIVRGNCDREIEDIDIASPSSRYQVLNATPFNIEFLQWDCDQVSSHVDNSLALFLDTASTQHPLVLTLFTLDITQLSCTGLASIEKVLSRSKIEYLCVACTPVDPSLAESIAQLLTCVNWSALKALVVSGDHINEWLQLWPSIATPLLVSLEIRGTGTGSHKLSHSSMLRVHQWIYANSLIVLRFANVTMQDKHAWAFLEENMDPLCLRRFRQDGTSDDRFKACGNVKDRYNSKFQTG
ncbi:hypothetical protein BG000_010736 [Podila horticola]|nr:hypothetical protein BG000_010736 [Podila horticola]